MNIKDEKSTKKVDKYKFNDHFVKKFEKFAKLYDKELKNLRSVEKEINGISHGVCNTAYRFRYITPSDISTFVANLDKSLSMGLIKPSVGDCNMFAVTSVKKIMEEHNCAGFGTNTVMGNTHSNIPSAATLKDLELLVGNEVFKTEIYSKYEMTKRVKAIRDQVKTFDDMHFTAAVRSLITKLPTIIQKHSETACACCDIKCSEILGAYVCQFISFALKLNLMTIAQMLHYAIPKSTFNTVSDPEHTVSDMTIQEAFLEYMDGEDDVAGVIQTDPSKDNAKKPIFFVFSEGIAPIISDAIRKATDSKFSHVGIAFEPDCRKIYTYTARGSQHENYVSGETGFGFTVDSMNDLRRQNINVSVMVGFIGADKVDKIMDEIEDFASHKTKFDVGLFIKYLTKNSKPGKNKYAQVCSTFCNYVLGSAGIKLSDEPVASPGGIKNRLDTNEEMLNNVFEVFYGNSNDYDETVAAEAAEQFAAKDGSRAFDEMYTECFHCTKPDAEIRSKIPFNINFRDVVLTDNHPYYKNTKCALEYIIKNPKSPFNHLIVKFATDEADGISAAEVTSLMYMMFGERLNDEISYNDPYYRTDVQFPSDPNWLDKIAYGNAYYDLNYRRDNPGNHHSDPITEKFNVLYKMFAACPHETDSSKLANSALKIKSIMDAIIEQRKVSTDWQMPRELSTEMLAVLGEIFTRVIMKLYHLNTIVIDFSDDMDDTIIPGYMYEFVTDDIEDSDGIIAESFIIMEADEDANNDVKIEAKEVKEAGVKNKDLDNFSDGAKAMHTLKMAWQKVMDWFQKIAGMYFTNWEKAQEKLLKYINDNANLADEIAKALDNKTFNITLSNYTPFKIQMKAISALDPKSVIDEALNNTSLTYGPETKEAIELERNLYPDITGENGEKLRDAVMKVGTKSGGDTSAEKANEATTNNRGDIIRNFVLFNQSTTPDANDTYELTGDEFLRIKSDLLETKTGIAPVFNKLIESYKNAAKDINTKLDELEKEANTEKTGDAANNIANDTSGTQEAKDKTANMNEEQKAKYNRMQHICSIVRRAQDSFVRASTDAIIGCPKDNKDYAAYKNSFWGKSYKIFALVVAEYQSRDKNATTKKTETSETKTEETNSES